MPFYFHHSSFIHRLLLNTGSRGVGDDDSEDDDSAVPIEWNYESEKASKVKISAFQVPQEMDVEVTIVWMKIRCLRKIYSSLWHELIGHLCSQYLQNQMLRIALLYHIS